MTEFEVVVALMAAAVGLSAAARWLRLPYPVLLVVGGLLVSLQPGVPRYELPPHLVLSAFLPPLLYAAAYNTHWPSFRKNLRAITLLAVGLVLFTTVSVGWAAHTFAGMAWVTALVLGAVVSPPDAVAALAVTQRVRIPRTVSAVIEGESLINDASALVAYRLAVGAAVSGTFSLGEGAAEFVAVSAGGVLAGVAGGWLVTRLHKWLDTTGVGDAKIVIAITLLTPYALYLPAERLHVSGVLAVVTAGMWVGVRSHTVFTPDLQVEARGVWEMVEFLLNGLIFILIGFQLPTILEALGGQYTVPELVVAAVAASGATVLSRLLWVFPMAYLPRWLDKIVLGEPPDYPPLRSVALVAWTGMRGVVSLAAALAIPKLTAAGEAFPARDLIVFLTFWVIFATLVGQGMTLPLLIRLLGVNQRADPDELRKTQGGVRAYSRVA